MTLPMLQEVIALVGRGKAVNQFQRPPMRFRPDHVVEGLNARDSSVGDARGAAAGRQRAHGNDVHGVQSATLTMPELGKEFSTNSWDTKLNCRRVRGARRY